LAGLLKKTDDAFTRYHKGDKADESMEVDLRSSIGRSSQTIQDGLDTLNTIADIERAQYVDMMNLGTLDYSSDALMEGLRPIYVTIYENGTGLPIAKYRAQYTRRVSSKISANTYVFMDVDDEKKSISIPVKNFVSGGKAGTYQATHLTSDELYPSDQ